MNWYKKQSGTLEDFFSDLKKRKIIKEDPPSFRIIKINLYRGFNADLSKIKEVNGFYILSPSKCEQGVLWFAHDLQMNPKQYYEGRGEYLLVYPLEIKKHFIKTYWDNGESGESPPRQILDLSCATENCKYWGEFELPEGFYFSYKTEKHIITDQEIKVSRDMIRKNIIEEE